MNPIATLYLAGHGRIVIELLPEWAPNTVNSFLYAALNRCYDRFAIERIVPGDWIDCSYTAFGKAECKYLIPNECAKNPALQKEIPGFGCVCMGGYPHGISGCEFFFPLRDCPELAGRFPVFGHVIEGLEELRRLEQVETVPVEFPDPEVIINRPVSPEIIARVESELNGYQNQPPIKITDFELPLMWQS